MRTTLRALGLLFAAALAAGCGKEPPAGDRAQVIKVISSLPRQGSAQAQTITVENGIRMAFEDAGWKAGAFTIEFEPWDDASAAKGAWDPAVEAANADRAVKDPDIMAYIGTYNSGAAKIAMPKTNQASLLMMSPANTAAELTKSGFGDPDEPGRYRPTGKVNYFRVVPADDLQGSLGADWAKRLGARSVFVLDDREAYGKGVADIFARRAKEIGLTVLGHEGIDPMAAEFKSLMAKIAQSGADLVYFGGTTQSGASQLVKDLRAASKTAKFMCPDGCFENAFIQGAGAENATDCYLTFGGVPPEHQTGKGKAFVERYRQKYGSMPEAYSVYGYEAAAAVLEAIRRSGKKDREAIRAACATIKDFDGALGKWSFDENGDTTLTTMSGNTVRNGKFEFAGILQRAADR